MNCNLTVEIFFYAIFKMYVTESFHVLMMNICIQQYNYLLFLALRFG